MNIDRSEVKRILIITLSNIGDIVLTTPVIRAMKKEFPGGRVDVMAGPAGKEIFEKDPAIFKFIIYDKHMPISDKRRLQLKLKRLHYDLVIDIRNTVFPLLIGPKYRTATIQKFPKDVAHSSRRHLYRLMSLGIDRMGETSYIHIPGEDQDYAVMLLKNAGITDRIVVVSPGAKSHLKRWTTEGFAVLADRLIEECGAEIVFVGTGEDAGVVEAVIAKMRRKAHNFTGKTNARQLTALLKRSKLLITNDSAPLHVGCAAGTKVLALFGPTNFRKYGPTGEFDTVIFEKLSCSPCEDAVCKHNYECMKAIKPERVFEAAKIMLLGYE